MTKRLWVTRDKGDFITEAYLFSDRPVMREEGDYVSDKGQIGRFFISDLKRVLKIDLKPGEKKQIKIVEVE